ncbi:MAG: glycosyltransferase [Candidatus Omnitrophota bacterium]
MYKFSIIIPTFNRSALLQKALGSVINQSYKNFEIIVVDDGSTDDTESVVEVFRKQIKFELKYLRQANQGVSAARNNGILAAKGEFICFLDSDDLYSPNTLELRAKALDLYKVEVVFGKPKLIINNDESNIQINHFLPGHKDTVIENRDKLYMCDAAKYQNIIVERGVYGTINDMTINRNLMINIGMFNENYRRSEDIECWYRLFFNIKKFAYVDEVFSIYNYSCDETHLRSDFEEYFLEERKRLLALLKYLRKTKSKTEMIAAVQKRLYSKRFKTMGIRFYRKFNSFRALNYFVRSYYLNKNDEEIKGLIYKALIPGFIRKLLRK